MFTYISERRIASKSSDDSTSTPGVRAKNALCSRTLRSLVSGVASKQNSDRVKLRPRRPPIQLSGWFVPVSPSTCHRAAMPCRNSSGNVASDASSTPSARNPFQVNATDTHRFSRLTVSRPPSPTALSPVWPRAKRAPGGLLKRKKFISPSQALIAGTRVNKMYWMSSNSSIICSND